MYRPRKISEIPRYELGAVIPAGVNVITQGDLSWA